MGRSLLSFRNQGCVGQSTHLTQYNTNICIIVYPHICLGLAILSVFSGQIFVGSYGEEHKVEAVNGGEAHLCFRHTLRQSIVLQINNQPHGAESFLRS